MDYKIVLAKGAEEDLDRFVAYLLFEKKSEQAARNGKDCIKKERVSKE